MLNKKHTDRKLKILFRAEAGESQGLGHLSRCRALAEIFIYKFNAECYFALTNQKIGLEFLKDLPISIISPKKIRGDASFDMTITDIPDLPLPEQKMLTDIGQLSVGIDDEGNGPFCFDIIVRPNLLDLPPPEIFSKCPLYLTGRDYIILNSDFSQYDYNVETLGKELKEILVCFGGSDPAGLSLRIIPILKQLKSTAHIDIVLGSAFKGVEEVKSQTNNNPQFRVTTNCRHLANKIANTDIAIISGGTLIYEVASLGIPAAVLCQNQAQEDEAVIFDKAGAIINLGRHDQVDDIVIYQKIQQLISIPSKLRQMSINAKAMITSSGAKSIAKKIMQWWCLEQTQINN